MNWTRERTELLKRYWAEGVSASRIAFLLGGFEHCDDGGRNAVIGKVHRMKLAGRETTVSGRQTTEERGQEGQKAQEEAQKGPQERALPRDPSSILRRPTSRTPVSLDLPLTDLEPGQCKWPHGDGPFLFCGHAVEASAVYCAFHKRIAYRPAERQTKPFVVLGFRKVAA